MTVRRSQVLLVALTALLLVPPSDAVIKASTETPSAAVITEARDLYGTEHVTVTPASGTHFQAAFPNFQLFHVTSLEKGFPLVHALGSAPQPYATLRDVTQDFNLLIEDLGATNVISTATTATKFAKAYVEVAQLEFQQQREILDARHSDDFGLTIQDPRSVATVGGFRASLTTWDRVNGVLLDWTLTFTYMRLQTAQWSVRAVGAGPFQPDPHGLLFQLPHQTDATYNSLGGGASITTYVRNSGGGRTAVDNVLDNEHIANYYVLNAAANSPSAPDNGGGAGVPPGHTVLASTENFDGSVWKAIADESVAPTASLLTLARALADGGSFAYNSTVRGNPVTDCMGSTRYNDDVHNWGFTSIDRDCVLLINLFHPDSLAFCGAFAQTASDESIPGSEEQAGATVLYIHPRVDLCVAKYDSDANYANGLSGVYNGALASALPTVAVAHEHFHYLQYVETGALPWSARGINWEPWREGMAVFSVTALLPDVESQQNTFWTAFSNKFQQRTYMGMCEFDSDQGVASAEAAETWRLWFNRWTDASSQEKLVLAAPPERSGYSYAPFWGQLYGLHETGEERTDMGVISSTLHGLWDVANSSGEKTCVARLPAVVNASLDPFDQDVGDVLKALAGAATVGEASWRSTDFAQHAIAPTPLEVYDASMTGDFFDTLPAYSIAVYELLGAEQPWTYRCEEVGAFWRSVNAKPAVPEVTELPCDNNVDNVVSAPLGTSEFVASARHTSGQGRFYMRV